MGKTHEALERAEQEHGKNLSMSGFADRGEDPLPKKTDYPIDKSCYQSLKSNLLSRYPDGSVKSLLFAGLREGDGASTTAVNFAAVMAGDRDLKVLLVDANLRTPSLHETFKIDYAPGLKELVTNGDDVSAQGVRVGPDNLYVLPCGGKSSGPEAVFESPRFSAFLKAEKERFDYVILDAPPVLAFPDSRIIGAGVDGVVLVVRSGSARKQIAVRAKKAMEEAGARVIGVVLNRRKFYIPNWLYGRL